MAQKAVRGSGAPWGVAEEAGWAIRWLCRAGLDGPGALASALEAGDLSALNAGIALSDAGVRPDQLIPSAATLTLPFIARLAPSEQALCYSAGGQSLWIWATGCSGDLASRELSLTGLASAPDVVTRTRVPLEAQTYRILSDFAARTYAPATEASRLGGAGAGLTDND